MKRLAAILSSVCLLFALASCSGNGELDGTSEQVYGVSAGSSSSASGSSGSDPTKTFTIDDIIELSNSGDVDSMVSFFQADAASSDAAGETSNMGNPDDMDTIALSASEIGLSADGSVTLTMSGVGVNYSADASMSADGLVYLQIPKIAVGTEITVSLDVKRANGCVVRSGCNTQIVSEGIQFSLSLAVEPPLMKTGDDINAVLLGMATVGSFAPSTTPPPSWATTALLSDAESGTDVLAWFDGGSVLYYAEGFTDVGKKIPLNADSSSMFQNCSSMTSVNVSGFDTGTVTNLGSMFAGCGSLSSITGLEGFDTSKVTDMSSMFHECEALTVLDLSSFNTGSVTNMSSMFNDCPFLETIYASSSFVTGQVTSSAMMFYFCASLKGTGGGHADTECDDAHVDKAYARLNGAGGQPGYFTAR